MRRYWALFACSLALGAALLAACGGGGGDTNDPTATSASSTPVLTPGEQPGPNEIGQSPFFLRTQDKFQSVTSGEDYKVVIRLTNGYGEDTLEISAEPDTGALGASFQATKVEAADDLPGTYYTVNLNFPQPGTWSITATAGADDFTLPVTVQ